jgi:hypothetical protein
LVPARFLLAISLLQGYLGIQRKSNETESENLDW